MAHSRGASHQTARRKPESPFVEANVTMSHRPASLHLSLSGWYPAVPFSCNSFSLCLHLFLLLSLSPYVSLCSPSSCPSVCLWNQLLLTSFSALYLPRQPSECYPHCLVLCLPRFHSSSGTTFFLPVIIQPQLNSKKAFFITLHSLTLSAFIHSVSSVLSSCQPVDIF